ncbi:MAG: PFL_4669 family integrating conjugative element protein [Hydrogenovibrio sp.]
MAQQKQNQQPGHIAAKIELTLHTRQSLKVFRGRKADPENDVVEIKGMQIFTGLIKDIWLDMIDGNPFARWWIYKYEQALKDTQQDILKLTNEVNDIVKPYEAAIDLSRSEATKPVTVTINYASPYSYKLVYLLIEIDQLIARMLTLKHMGLLTPAQFESIRKNLMGTFYRCMYSVTKYKSIKGLTDAELDKNTELAQQAIEAMGQPPELITSGSYIPELMPNQPRARIVGFHHRPKPADTEPSTKKKSVAKAKQSPSNTKTGKGSQDDSSTE